MRLFKSELLKSVTGRTWLWLFLTGFAMAALASFGYAQEGDQPGMTDSFVTSEIARTWMMVYLLAALLGSALYGRDKSTGGLSRSVIVGGRRPVLLAKLGVTLVWGTLYGIAAATMAYLAPILIQPLFHSSASWSDDAYLSILGVFLSCPLAAVFGLCIGVLTNSRAAAIGIVVFTILFFDPALQRLFPSVAKYSFSISLTAVARDSKEQLLTQPAAVAVAVIWVMVLFMLTYAVFERRDVA